MFDTRIVGKTIRSRRMERNMTQMDLADAMGVSYQAVSNWERGNSAPDIGKLEQLCSVLGISIGELLDARNQETAVVQKVLTREPVTMEEVTLIAPILPPQHVEEQVSKAEKGTVTKEVLSILAPYLDEEALLEMARAADLRSLRDYVEIAPFLSQEALDTLVRQAPMDWDGIEKLAVYLGDDTLDYLIHGMGGTIDENVLKKLAVYLSEKALDELTDKCIAAGTLEVMAKAAVYLSSESISKLAKACIQSQDLETLKKIAVYL